MNYYRITNGEVEQVPNGKMASHHVAGCAGVHDESVDCNCYNEVSVAYCDTPEQALELATLSDEGQLQCDNIGTDGDSALSVPSGMVSVRWLDFRGKQKSQLLTIETFFERASQIADKIDSADLPATDNMRAYAEAAWSHDTRPVAFFYFD